MKAPFIRTRSAQTTAFIVTFRDTTLPDVIYIPEERTDTMVYRYRNLPMICRKCQAYGHTIKRCKSNVRCLNCRKGHERDWCGKATSCLYCRLCHQVRDRECSKQQAKPKICDIKEEKRVTIRAQLITEQKECCLPPDHSTSVYFNCFIEEN